MAALKGKVEQLSKAGLKAELLSSTDLQEVEPALVVGEEGGAAFLPDDYQLDARRSVAYIEKVPNITPQRRIAIYILNIWLRISCRRTGGMQLTEGMGSIIISR